MSNGALRAATAGATTESPAAAGTALAPRGAAGQLQAFLEKHKAQFAVALPKHLNPDRMIRLALTAFNSNKAIRDCDMGSIAGSIVMASQMGLEIGVAGQGYLVPYKGKCQFIPGWQGYVDLVSRSGRASCWTGAVFEGDQFEYALGDRPFVKHVPCGEDDWRNLQFVYAIGRANGSDWPVIEVWPIAKVWKHRDRNNKVGAQHYSFKHPEMYARKVPLLQVVKYMPKSIELTNALTADYAHEAGQHASVVDNTVMVDADFRELAEGGDTDRDLIPADEVERRMRAADSLDGLNDAADFIRDVEKPADRSRLTGVYNELLAGF